MDRALTDGRGATLLYRKWPVESDAALDRQAYVLRPESAIAIAEAIVRASRAVAAGRNAALAAVRRLRGARRSAGLKVHPRELSWLDRIEKTVETIPDSEAELIAEMTVTVDTTRLVPADYAL